jgi:hypothetical protein
MAAEAIKIRANGAKLLQGDGRRAHRGLQDDAA